MRMIKHVLLAILALTLVLFVACDGSGSSSGDEIKSQTDVVDSGSFNCNLDDIETDTDSKTLSCSFIFENLDDYEKNPADFLEVIAIQDKEELPLKDGSISMTVEGLTKVDGRLITHRHHPPSLRSMRHHV